MLLDTDPAQVTGSVHVLCPFSVSATMAGLDNCETMEHGVWGTWKTLWCHLNRPAL